MYLLKKINSDETTFEFYKILESSYEIKEERDTIAKKKMANGTRKRISSSYIDCVISIDLGGIDNTDLDNYLENLKDGTYEYYSFEDRQYKQANFLVGKSPITANRVYSTNQFFIDDITVTLEKSSDVI